MGLILILLNVCFYVHIVESSSFAFCWQKQFVEFLVELFINSV